MYQLTLGARYDRKSASVVVLGEVVPTAQQMAEIQHRYNVFRMNVAHSVGSYLSHVTKLADGTDVRFESNNGMDRIFVRAYGGGFKPLALAGFVLRQADASHTTGWGTTPRAYLHAKSEKLETNVRLQAGAVDWRSADGKVILSWDHGGTNRYQTSLWSSVFNGQGGGVPSPAQGIYYKGTKIDTPAGVIAAAIFGGKLVFVSGDLPPRLYSAPSPVGKIDAALEQGKYIAELSPTWVVQNLTVPPADYGRVSAWHFAPDGSKAACAVVYHSYGWGTWQNLRMRTEALPQGKRYLTLAQDSAGNVTGTISDVAYAGEAFYCDAAGTRIDTQTYATYPLYNHLVGVGATTAGLPGTFSGALAFGGKRLWAIDFAADGSELVIECKRTGTGTINVDTTHPAYLHYAVGYTTKWGVYVNGTELVAAHYTLPTIDYYYDVASGNYTFSQPGTGAVSYEFIGLHELDARSMSCVVERVTLAAAGAFATVNTTSAAYQATIALARTITRETYFAGAQVESVAETPRAGQPLAGKATGTFMDASRWADIMRYGGLTFNASATSYNSTLVQYPVAGNYHGESYYEVMFQAWEDHGDLTNRTIDYLFQCYPNQVTDALYLSAGGYDIVITAGTNQAFFFWTAQGSGPGGPDSSWGNYINNQFQRLGVVSALARTMAQRDAAPLEAVTLGRDSFLFQLEEVLAEVRDYVAHGSYTLSAGFAPLLPAYTGKHWQRPDTFTPWTSADLRANAFAKAPTGADPNSFHLDPVGPL